MLKATSSIVNVSQITGVLPVLNGGTGVTTSTGTGNNVLSAAPTFSGNVTFSTGNLIVASGQGIDFSATPGTGTSELFDDYEEGTWTPIDTSGATLTFTSPLGSYTRIGRMVYAQMIVIYPATVNAFNARIGGLPFTVADTDGIFSPSRGGSSVTFSDANISMFGNLSQGATEFFLFNQATTVNVTNANLSGKVLRMTFAYPA